MKIYKMLDVLRFRGVFFFFFVNFLLIRKNVTRKMSFIFRNWRGIGWVRSRILISRCFAVIRQRFAGHWKRKSLKLVYRISQYTKIVFFYISDIIFEWSGVCDRIRTDFSFLFPMAQAQGLFGIFRRDSRRSVRLAHHRHVHRSLRFHRPLQRFLPGCHQLFTPDTGHRVLPQPPFHQYRKFFFSFRITYKYRILI